MRVVSGVSTGVSVVFDMSIVSVVFDVMTTAADRRIAGMCSPAGVSVHHFDRAGGMLGSERGGWL